MMIRRLLLLMPIVCLLFLLQSCLWVPNYQQQDRGDTGRSASFVEASIGDAKLLNPILNADTASSRIVGLVFDGLLELDEDLNLVPRVATSWALTETIWVSAPGGDVAAFADDVRSAIDADPVLKDRVSQIKVGEPTEALITLPPVDEGEDKKPRELTVTVAPRLQIDLSEVTPDFEKRLESLLGEISIADSVTVAPGDAQSVTAAVIAEQLQVVEHNPVLEFKLRDDVKFHDGHSLDSGDVVFTWRAIMNPKNLSPRTSDFEPVKDVQAVGAHGVRVIYKRLFSPAVLAWTMPLLPEHLLNDEALESEMDRREIDEEARKTFGQRQANFSRNPIGTGPYQFVEWQSDELITLKATGKHFVDKPDFVDFTYRVLPDSLAQELELKSGGIDIYSPQPYQVERFAADPRFQTLSLPGDGYSYIAYNNRLEKFRDPRVRRALSMAIDIDSVIRYVLYGEGERATGPYALSTRWNDPSVAPQPYDPEAAIKLLAEAGYSKNADGILSKDGEPLEFTLITNQGNRVREAIMSIAQDAWKSIGVKITTQKFEWAVFLEDFVNPGKFDALVLGWKLGSDPDLYQLWHSSQTGFGQLNFTGYSNEKVDALIEEIRSEYNEDRQQELTYKLHALIAADQPYTFLYAPRKNAVLMQQVREKHADNSIGEVRESASGQVYQNFYRWTKSASLTAGEG